ncbi:RHS repeat-associated core domain-containing protein [Burkholderia pseudomallei]|uniref:RHS repeat-associated core domain-containing protein n=1 Tax=Burkholderia pseudomallei TaxID=28450 RepID=UPI00168A3FDB|nr:RHS repeat-associated core domain-containing protein [Burkholderia pseudomallei]MBD2941397.1 type IV secretion protein Rhs [Burkholderia pseudomallei]MBD2947575.1 type IV secretion protein Rhs [Burkholderia pseudomallei]MBD2984706.1 type IV secretion protein Rhs [Burkholderia pseudomallei]MBD2990431.1 type IV secretion protein Rhs [Burkholderia pseudomallei]
MALPAVKHLDPVVGVDVHAVIVAPEPAPIYLPHPHVGFVLDLREYIDAALGVIGSIVFTFVEEEAIDYLQDNPDVANELDHALKSAATDLQQADAELMRNPLIAGGVKFSKAAGSVAGDIASSAGDIANAAGAGVGMGSVAGRPIFINGFLRATAGTHSFHVPGLHFPLGESFAPPPAELPSNDAESYMGSRTVLANNDPLSFMALPAMSCWSIGLEPPPHNGAHTERTALSMPSSVMLPIPVGRPVLVGGPPIMNMAALASSLFKAFRGSKWARALADKLNLKPGFLRCTVLGADPVDMITGEVVMQQHDFTVSGRLPLVWDRHYTSHDMRRGAVGVGWQTPADIRLELMRHEGSVGAAAYFPGHATAFDAMPDAAGWPARVYDWQHGHALYQQDDCLLLRTRAGIEYAFALPAHWQYALERLADDATLTLLLGRMADRNGNAWVFERRLDGSLARLVEWKGDEATGRAIECEAAAGSRAGGHADLLTSLTLIDSGGRAHPLVGYEYDRNGNLVAALDAMSQPHHFAYADGHRMVRHTSARGVSFYYSHRRHDDGVWRVDHAWGDNGLLDYRFVYDIEHRETRITDSLGHTTVFQANERGMPVAKVDALGGAWSYRYDAQWRTSAATDPAGRITTWEYDAYGNLLAQTLPDGSVVRAEYNANQKPACLTAPGDRQWRYAWDERGNLLTRTTPAQACMCYEYDRLGQLIAHTGLGGAMTCFDYDRDGNLVEIIDALGRCTRYTYDARANVIQTVNALSQVSRYEYDPNGNLMRAIEPSGRESFYSYDADGNLVRYCAPNGQVTQLEYSALGQVTKRSTPEGSVIHYRYDTEARLVGVVNERGESYRLERDMLGRVVEEVDYWGQSQRYEYGAMGEMLRSIDPLGQAIDYKTDTLGRIAEKRVPDPRQHDGIRTETFSYDRSGNLTVAETPDSRVELMYDAAGRIVEERCGADFKIANVYDIDGERVERVTRILEAGTTTERVTRYEYDAVKLVASIAVDGVPPITFERDSLGRIRTERFGDVLRRDLTYTADGLLDQQTLLRDTGPLFASEYAYDANGEMVVKRGTGSVDDYFRYDPIGRLVMHFDSTGRQYRFACDKTGDLLTTRIRQGNQTGIFGQGMQTDTWIREGEHDGCYYAFDRIGNLVRKKDAQQDLTLCWDGAGLLIESCVARPVRTQSGQGGLTLHGRTRYSYDALHRRTKKITQLWLGTGGIDDACHCASSPSCTTRFFWDGDVLIAALSHSDRQFDQLLARATRGVQSAARAPERPDGADDGNSALPDAISEHQEWVSYPGTSHPLVWLHDSVPAASMDSVRALSTGGEHAEAHPPTIYWLSTDPNGMPIRGDDIRRGTSWQASYAPWGAVDRSASTPEVEQQLRFLGQYEDRETNLFYNRYRYYDPSTAQYISIDPIRLDGGENLYRYARNALGWTDSLGLSRVPVQRIRYFGHPNPAIEALVRAKVVQFLEKHPDLVESGEDNIAIALLDDGSLSEPVAGNQIAGHPEARLMRLYPNRIKCLWSENQPCDLGNYYGKANQTMHIKDTPCQTLIDVSEGLEAVFYYIATGSATSNAAMRAALRKYAVKGHFARPV